MLVLIKIGSPVLWHQNAVISIWSNFKPCNECNRYSDYRWYILFPTFINVVTAIATGATLYMMGIAGGYVHLKLLNVFTSQGETWLQWVQMNWGQKLALEYSMMTWGNSWEMQKTPIQIQHKWRCPAHIKQKNLLDTEVKKKTKNSWTTKWKHYYRMINLISKNL